MVGASMANLDVTLARNFPVAEKVRLQLRGEFFNLANHPNFALIGRDRERPDSGIYAFQTAPLLAHLDQLTANNANREVILTDMASLLDAAGERVVAIQAEAAVEVLGANTIAELVALDAQLHEATASRLMAAGVTISGLTPASSTPRSRSPPTPSSSPMCSCSAAPASARIAASALTR